MVAAASAFAAPKLSPGPKLRACIAEGGKGGCKALPAGSLQGASGIALSPDGRNVYVTAYGADTVTTFKRTSGGGLRFAGCVANGGAGGCADPASDVLGGAGGIAVSPGGGDVYVASGLGRSVSRFARRGGGALTLAACTANEGRGGCADPAADTLFGAAGLVVGPGGSDIYVTSFDAASVSQFRRGADGSLALASCTADAGNFGCRQPPGNVLEGAAAVALDPKGRHAYVASFNSSSISYFARVKGGRLAYRGCYADGGANGCAKLPDGVLLGATGVAVSSDGRSVYVASQVGIISRFSRTPRNGRLKLASCIGKDGKGGCTEPARDSLDGATALAVAPNGRTVYAAAQTANAVTRLQVDRRGKLRYAGCTAAEGARRCSSSNRTALRGAYAIARRGRDLYTTAAVGAAVATLRTGR